MHNKQRDPRSRRQFMQHVGLGLLNVHTLTRSNLAAAALSGQTAIPRLYQHSARPQNYETPVALLHKQGLTPVESLFIRCHFDVPQVDVNAWRLHIKGLVHKTQSLSLAELNQFPQTSIEAVLQCSGNGRALFKPHVPGVQWNRGGMGNVVWTGVPLKLLLDKVGTQDKSEHLIMRGADQPVLPTTPEFIRSIPLSKALHPDTLIATRMNGLPIPAAHGGPARVIVPGWVADDCINWVTELSVSEHEATGFYFEKAYRYPALEKGSDTSWSKQKTVPMTELSVKSVITAPLNKATLALGNHEISGVAFSGGKRITNVRVSTDAGKSWHSAALTPANSAYAWSVWKYNWQAQRSGNYQISVCATDEQGNSQPAKAHWNHGGYLWNAIDSINVTIRG